MKEYIVQAIEQETIDTFNVHNAPELIRCKDCIHREHCEIVDGFGKSAEWFCADGRSKEDD